MASKLDICNMALSYVDDTLIVDTSALDSSSDKNARLCRLHFDQVKRSVLRSHKWLKATKRATLSQDTVGPTFGNYTYSYTLPPDCIFVQKLNEVDIGLDDEIYYKIEDHKILTDETTANIVYTADVEVGKLDDLCVDQIALTLAGRLAFGINGNSQREQELYRLAYDFVAPTARSINSLEAFEPLPHRTKHSRRFLSRRRGTNG